MQNIKPKITSKRELTYKNPDQILEKEVQRDPGSVILKKDSSPDLGPKSCVNSLFIRKSKIEHDSKSTESPKTQFKMDSCKLLTDESHLISKSKETTTHINEVLYKNDVQAKTSILSRDPDASSISSDSRTSIVLLRNTYYTTRNNNNSAKKSSKKNTQEIDSPKRLDKKTQETRQEACSNNYTKCEFMESDEKIRSFLHIPVLLLNNSIKIFPAVRFRNHKM